MGKVMRGVFIACAMAVLWSPGAYCDRRSYVWTYEYQTMPQGATEVEYYLTARVPDSNKSSDSVWEHQVELEYGITDRWDVSMYQRFEQDNRGDQSDFEYKGLKLRTRYRLGEAGQYIVDPLLYLEYKRDDELSEPHELEWKLVLANDFGNLNASFNYIGEVAFDSTKEVENEYAAGLSYEFVPAFKAGVEWKGSLEDSDSQYMGPTISWGQEKFWLAFGALFGFDDRSDDLQTRMIMGIPF